MHPLENWQTMDRTGEQWKEAAAKAAQVMEIVTNAGRALDEVRDAINPWWNDDLKPAAIKRVNDFIEKMKEFLGLLALTALSLPEAQDILLEDFALTTRTGPPGSETH